MSVYPTLVGHYVETKFSVSLDRTWSEPQKKIPKTRFNLGIQITFRVTKFINFFGFLRFHTNGYEILRYKFHQQNRCLNDNAIKQYVNKSKYIIDFARALIQNSRVTNLKRGTREKILLSSEQWQFSC